MPSCVCLSCGADVQVDALRRFARCSCGTTVSLAEECASLEQEFETIVGRLKRLEEALAADLDRVRASCAQLDDFTSRPTR